MNESLSVSKSGSNIQRVKSAQEEIAQGNVRGESRRGSERKRERGRERERVPGLSKIERAGVRARGKIQRE